jgi:hypothetical protein
MTDNKHTIFYGRGLSMVQPQRQSSSIDKSLDDLRISEQLKEIKSWFTYSVVNAFVFMPIIFWMIPLHYSFQVKLFKKRKQLDEAQKTSYSALKTNIFVTLIGVFTYAWLTPAIVLILISNKNS